MSKRRRETELSAVSVPPDKIQKNVERSHEQNQERAYVAASRRTDRSIEARVQSARMASAIHKKRTGRGFKVSEEVVQNEEMYEEEDDEPSMRYLAISGQFPPESARARQLEIDNLFAKQFPYAPRLSQHMALSIWPLCMFPANASLFTCSAAKVPQDKCCPPRYRSQQLHSEDAQSLADSSPSRYPSPEIAPTTQAGEEDSSLPALTPPSYESDCPSSLPLLSVPSPVIDTLLCSTNPTSLNETQSEWIRAAEFPLDINFIAPDASTAQVYSADIPPIKDASYGIGNAPITSEPPVQSIPPGLHSQPSSDMNTSAATGGENGGFNDEGSGWETWLNPDFLPVPQDSG
ncbi:hypothetical protein BX600DRAFT_72080 [Xylariales sp. PMI_506]|nr:hypothetical protein BX600DRAFT_72080 [Xylariales sp. PMI_506]